MSPQKLGEISPPTAPWPRSLTVRFRVAQRKRQLLGDATEQLGQAAALGHTAAPFQQRSNAKMQQAQAFAKKAMALQQEAMDDQAQAMALCESQDQRLQEGRDTLEEAAQQSADEQARSIPPPHLPHPDTPRTALAGRRQAGEEEDATGVKEQACACGPARRQQLDAARAERWRRC